MRRWAVPALILLLVAFSVERTFASLRAVARADAVAEESGRLTTVIEGLREEVGALKADATLKDSIATARAKADSALIAEQDARGDSLQGRADSLLGGLEATLSPENLPVVVELVAVKDSQIAAKDSVIVILTRELGEERAAKTAAQRFAEGLEVTIDTLQVRDSLRVVEIGELRTALDVGFTLPRWVVGAVSFVAGVLVR